MQHVQYRISVAQVVRIDKSEGMGTWLCGASLSMPKRDPLCFCPLCTVLLDESGITCLGGGDRILPAMSASPSGGWLPTEVESLPFNLVDELEVA